MDPLPSLVQVEKYRKADFGRCPRVYCYSQPLLPVGLSDIPYQKAVKLYCPRCEDLYSPKSNRHGSIDGAYFGTTFPHMLFMVYPQMIPGKGQPVGSSSVAEVNRSLSGSGVAAIQREREGPSTSTVGSVNTGAAGLKADRYEPRIFGFKVNEEARLSRWRTARRDRSVPLSSLRNILRRLSQPNITIRSAGARTVCTECVIDARTIQVFLIAISFIQKVAPYISPGLLIHFACLQQARSFPHRSPPSCWGGL